MNATLERLIALRDLLQLKRDLDDEKYGELGFETGAVDAVDEEIRRLESEIDPALLRRYQTIAAKYDRPLVPVRQEVCYGCFVRFPTAKLSQVSDEPLICESCGRILYPIP